MTDVTWRSELVRLIDHAVSVLDGLRQDTTMPEPNITVLERTWVVLQATRMKALACHIAPPDGQITLGLVRGITDWINDLDSPLVSAVGAIERHYLTIPSDNPHHPNLPDFSPVAISSNGVATPTVPDGQALIVIENKVVVDVCIWRRNDFGGHTETPVNDFGLAKDAFAQIADHAPELLDSVDRICVICPPHLSRLMVWPEDRWPPHDRSRDATTAQSNRRFLQFWDELFPETTPISHMFKHRLAKRWARIHSLPAAKRYAQTPIEWAELMRRQNTVIDSLVPQGATLRVVINFIEIDNYLFKAFNLENIGVFVDPEGETVCQSFQFVTTWESGTLNPILTMIAEDQMRGFIIGPQCLIAPYDGGIDIILKDPHTCWEFKRRFKAWLSPRADGL